MLLLNLNKIRTPHERFDQLYSPAQFGEDDDLTTAFYENEEIDLGQLMREQFYLALPMKPLCRDDCKDLCPNCGTNWNNGTCECKQEWEDPRLAALKTLKTDQHKGH